jgi:hypothetical protein
LTETVGKLEMPVVVHLLVFEQQQRILVNGEINAGKFLIVQRTGQVDTGNADTELGMDGFNYHAGTG